MRPAGPMVRALAWLIDFLFRIMALLSIVFAFAASGALGVGIMLLAWFLLEWFYPVLFEVLRNGATPGKALFGIKAVHDDGTPIGWRASVLRNLLRAVDFLPVLYGFGLIAVLSNRQFKRLGDLVAGTLVVYRDEPQRLRQLPTVDPHPPPVALTVDEQAALVSYAERVPHMPPQRVLELADVAAELSEQTGDDGVKRLLEMAVWSVGRR